MSLLCLEIHNFSDQTRASEVHAAEGQIKKGKDLESDFLDSDQRKSELKKNGSKTELPPLTSDKDVVQTKTRNQTGKPRQSQSGPLMPGTVLSHSTSERARNIERFLCLYYILTT